MSNEVGSLEEIADAACAALMGKDHLFNLELNYEFGCEILKGEGISEFTELARGWMADEKPEDLHINHGSYIVDGMTYLIEELRRKPSSNRAILSLLNQAGINESGDDPIPSFMIFQAGIEEDVLYCTVYFRALEVSSFLRLNLEEIRLRIQKIYEVLLSFSKVRLVIHAFRAYNNPKTSKLRKAALDRMDGVDIAELVLGDVKQIPDLIIEKASDSTVVSSASLRYLEKAVRNRWQGDGKERILSGLAKVIKSSDLVRDLRLRHSHHQEVTTASTDLYNSMLGLAEVFREEVDAR